MSLKNKLCIDGGYLPAINVIEDRVRPFSTIGDDQVFLNPVDQVILEDALDQLMEYVWREEPADIGSREIVCEGLQTIVRVCIAKGTS